MRPGALCVMASGQHLMLQWHADSLASYQLVRVGASFVSVCKTNTLIAGYSGELYMIIIPQELRHSTMLTLVRELVQSFWMTWSVIALNHDSWTANMMGLDILISAEDIWMMRDLDVQKVSFNVSKLS